MLPYDLLRHLTLYLPWKVLIKYYSTCKHLYRWIEGRNYILNKSIAAGCSNVLNRFHDCRPVAMLKLSNAEIMKKLYERCIHSPYNGTMVGILRLHTNYYIWNKILNERLKLWSPLFRTTQIDKTDEKWVVNCSGSSEAFETFRRTLQMMTSIVKAQIPSAASVVVVGCYYRNTMDRVPPTKLSVLHNIKIYADRYKEKTGFKRKREERLKNHIPTTYWRSPTEYTKSYHALQCFDTARGTWANVLTSFKLYRHQGKKWEWFIVCNFSKINIYCY